MRNAIFFATVVGLATAAATPAQQPLSVAERAALFVMNAPGVTNTIWPGFAVPERDWVIQDSTGAYLVTTKQPPASFVPHRRMFFRAGPLPNFIAAFELNYQLEHLTVVALRAATSVELTMHTLYHESFHAFQRAWRLNTVDYGAVGEISKAIAANIEVERRILRDLISGREVNMELLRQVLAVRARRVTLAGIAFARAERHAEHHEGLAEYVAARSVALALSQPEQSVASQVAVLLRTNMSIGGSADERLIRTRAYGTGAAMGLLLDRLGVDWKAQVPARALDELLADRAGALSDEIADAAYARYNYAAILAQGDRIWGQLSSMTEAAFAALAPYQLQVHVPPATSVGWNYSTSTARPSGMHRPAPGVLLLPFVQQLTASGAGLSLVVKNRSVKIAKSDDVEATLLTVLLDAPPKIAGAPVEPGPERTVSDLQLEAAGVALSIKGPVRVNSEAGRLIVRR